MKTICYNEKQETWEVSNRGGKRSYHDLALSVGFGDPTDQRFKNHAVIVGGISQTGKVDILEGFVGFWGDVLKETINLKDRYFCTKVISASKPESLLWELEDCEGLTDYQSSIGHFTNRKYYTNPPKTWPYFRSYELKARIELAPPETEKDIESACVHLETLVEQGRVRVPKRDWNLLWREMNKPLEEGIRSSVLKAAIWLVAYLEEEHKLKQKRERVERGPRIISQSYGDII